MPSQGPRAFQRRCSHPVRQVIEFNPLGAVVGCVLCDSTLDMTDEQIQDWVEFTHTSTRGKAHDLFLLVDPQHITDS